VTTYLLFRHGKPRHGGGSGGLILRIIENHVHLPLPAPFGVNPQQPMLLLRRRNILQHPLIRDWIRPGSNLDRLLALGSAFHHPHRPVLSLANSRMRRPAFPERNPLLERRVLDREPILTLTPNPRPSERREEPQRHCQAACNEPSRRVSHPQFPLVKKGRVQRKAPLCAALPFLPSGRKSLTTHYLASVSNNSAGLRCVVSQETVSVAARGLELPYHPFAIHKLDVAITEQDIHAPIVPGAWGMGVSR